MTDLERDWDDLPVGPVPLDAIRREARRSGARGARGGGRLPEQRLRRSLAVVGVAAGLAGAFVVGTLVSGPDGGTPGPGAALPHGGDVSPVAFQGELEAPASCEDLLASYVDRAVDVVGPYGWESAYDDYWRGAATRNDAGLSEVPVEQELGFADRSTATTTRSTSSETGTTVQEAGVDEPDDVKTDGTLLVRVRDAELTTYDVSGERVADLASLDLGDLEDTEILLAGDTVVVIGNDGTRPLRTGYYGDAGAAPQTRVITVDVSDPAAPTLLETVDYDSAAITARQHGDTVRLVLSAGLPDLDFVRPMQRRGQGGQRAAQEANERVVEESTLDDWLPRVSTDGGAPEQFLDCADVALPRADLALGTMAVVGFGADDPTALEGLGLAGDAPLAYESPDHLYLAASGPGSGFDRCLDFCVPPVDWPIGGTDTGTTHVYDFALDGTSASYVGAGEVEGSVADRWAMDEHDGVLRLAVGPTQETGNFNAVVLLRAEGDELVEIGRVDRLGVGEQIESVRWFDDLAIVVTFRQVDPLYTVDLTDQSDPRLLGELKIPGFSEYLHPLGTDRLVGVGQGPVGRGRWGAQVGLFDVTDLSDVRRLDVVDYGPTTEALAGTDPRQLTWMPEIRTVLTVVARGYGNRTGFVSQLTLADGRMSNRMVQVEYGADVDAVRLVPLPEDRVVLVTGEDVEFFDLTGV